MLREAGATEVHLRISSPPYRWPCYYGLDTGSRAELIAANLEVGEICAYIGADSLAFISIEGLYRALGEARRDSGMPHFCDACFTGDYPIPISDFRQGNLFTSLSEMAELT